MGLSRLLRELEEVVQDVQARKKEIVQARKEIAAAESDTYTARARAAEQLAVEVAAERFERAADAERQVSECDAELEGLAGQWQELLARYEALDAKEEECQRKVCVCACVCMCLCARVPVHGVEASSGDCLHVMAWGRGFRVLGLGSL